VRSRAGNWVVLHGARLGTSGRIAVIVEPAHSGQIYPLLMSAYGLTERERDATRLILQGNSTKEIAETLILSEHTVQQHLKSIFNKTGVHSRRDLVGKVFFTHYEPRFRDNERRVVQNKPVRGGPAADRRPPWFGPATVPLDEPDQIDHVRSL
jgi:DNA-binding CsgD family transcriptional regulator